MQPMMNHMAMQAVANTTPDTAPREFHAGYLFGQVGKDVKASMDECYPKDAKLARMMDDLFDGYA